MISNFTEDNNIKLTKVNKLVGDTHDQLSKALELLKRYKTEMQEIINFIENITADMTNMITV